MWGGKKGEKASIPVYMIFREKSERDEGIFHIKKSYVTSGHISQSIENNLQAN